MFPDNLTRAEARHRAGLIETSTYAVEVDLSGRAVADPATRFASTSTLTFTAREPGETHVDLIADHVVRAVLDGVDLDPADFTGARLPLRLDAGPHALTISAVCPYSRSGEGLHRFVDPADQRTYLYTQFEAADARRMYACFEQPDLKAALHPHRDRPGSLDRGRQHAWPRRRSTPDEDCAGPGSPRRCRSRPT